MKKLIEFIFEPIKAFASRNISEKISNFFNRRSFYVYVATTIVTLVIIYFKYYR